MSRWRALAQLEAHKPIKVASVEQWRNGKLGDGGVLPIAFFGAPMALIGFFLVFILFPVFLFLR